MANNALIVFIKNPELGKVKTRLAKTVGNEKALAIYKALMGHTREIALAVSTDRLLFYSQEIHPNDKWSTDDFKKHLQATGDLGTKMKTAFQQAFQDHQKVVIIGSDCASLTPAIVEVAFRQLEEHSFVIGPALDGGYYLLGMNQYAPSVFDDIAWSTASVLKDTKQRVKDLGLDYVLLPALSDIDYEEDWDKYGWDV